MPPVASQSSPKRGVPAARGALLLAFLLVAALWAGTVFRAEARMRRASLRVVRLVEKTGEESPVALGLAANRLGSHLATNAVLELEPFGPLVTGRQEIVQLFAQTRTLLAKIEFARPALAAATAGPGVVDVRVSARYRLIPDAGAAAEGDGQADLVWARGRDGWRIVRIVMRAEEGAQLPGGWK